MTKEEAINKMCLDKIYGYKSPIGAIVSDMQMTYENEVFKAVQNVGIIVDKEELIKALQYDRNQYEKGFADAKTQFDRQKGEWIEKSQFDRLCKNCGRQHIGDKRFANFCPNCGADMISSNSEIEKSKSEIIPDYRDGWRLKGGDEK